MTLQPATYLACLPTSTLPSLELQLSSKCPHTPVGLLATGNILVRKSPATSVGHNMDVLFIRPRRTWPLRGPGRVSRRSPLPGPLYACLTWELLYGIDACDRPAGVTWQSVFSFSFSLAVSRGESCPAADVRESQGDPSKPMWLWRGHVLQLPTPYFVYGVGCYFNTLFQGWDPVVLSDRKQAEPTPYEYFSSILFHHLPSTLGGRSWAP